VEEILRTRGIHALTLRAAARRAHVSHSAPAHHFRNKAGLLTTFAVEGFDRLSRSVGDAIARKAPRTAADLMETMFVAYVGFATSHPHHFTVMYRSELLNVEDAEYKRAGDRDFALLRQAVLRCVDEGLLQRRHADEATGALWSLGHGLVILKLSGRLTKKLPSFESPDFARRIIAFYVRAMLLAAARGGKKRAATRKNGPKARRVSG
jgi:AcrR family transcriptional regulator